MGITHRCGTQLQIGWGRETVLQSTTNSLKPGAKADDSARQSILGIPGVGFILTPECSFHNAFVVDIHLHF
jgi:hypothetical protein